MSDRTAATSPRLNAEMITFSLLIVVGFGFYQIGRVRKQEVRVISNTSTCYTTTFNQMVSHTRGLENKLCCGANVLYQGEH